MHVTPCDSHVTPSRRAYNLYATDIMQTQLDFLSYQSTYHELYELLQNTDHESYPLVDAPGKLDSSPKDQGQG